MCRLRGCRSHTCRRKCQQRRRRAGSGARRGHGFARGARDMRQRAHFEAVACVDHDLGHALQRPQHHHLRPRAQAQKRQAAPPATRASRAWMSKKSWLTRRGPYCAAHSTACSRARANALRTAHLVREVLLERVDVPLAARLVVVCVRRLLHGHVRQVHICAFVFDKRAVGRGGEAAEERMPTCVGNIVECEACAREPRKALAVQVNCNTTVGPAANPRAANGARRAAPVSGA